MYYVAYQKVAGRLRMLSRLSLVCLEVGIDMWWYVKNVTVIRGGMLGMS